MENEVPFEVEEKKPKKVIYQKYKVALKDPDGYLNVRAGAGLSFPVTGKLLNGEEVSSATDPVDGWVEIAEGKFVMAAKLKMI